MNPFKIKIFFILVLFLTLFIRTTNTNAAIDEQLKLFIQKLNPKQDVYYKNKKYTFSRVDFDADQNHLYLIDEINELSIFDLNNVNLDDFSLSLPLTSAVMAMQDLPKSIIEPLESASVCQPDKTDNKQVEAVEIKESIPDFDPLEKIEYFHLEAPSDPSQQLPRYLLVNTSAGLFNRVSLLSSAYALASLCRRHLVMSWQIEDKHMPVKWSELFIEPKIPTMEDMGKNFFLAFKKITAKNRGINITNTSNKYSEHFARIISNPDQRFSFSHYDPDKNENDLLKYSLMGMYRDCLNEKIPIVYLYGSNAIIPSGGSFNFDAFEKYYRKFHQLLKTREDVGLAIAKFADENFKDKDVIGIHVRTFNPKVEDKEFHRLYNGKIDQELISNMQKKVKEQSDMGREKELVFFVSTDDADILQHLKDKFPGKIVSYPHKEIHRDSLEGQMTGIIDWSLLTKTLQIIGTKSSSFSDEAAISVPQGKISVGETIYHVDYWGGMVTRKRRELDNKQKFEEILSDFAANRVEKLESDIEDLNRIFIELNLEKKVEILNFVLAIDYTGTSFIKKNVREILRKFKQTLSEIEGEYNLAMEMACELQQERRKYVLQFLQENHPLKDGPEFRKPSCIQ